MDSSHRGILGNELADSAAKEATKKQHVPPESTSASDLIDTLRKYVSQICHTYGKNLPEYNELQHIKPLLSLWRPISRKLQIFSRRLHVGHAYPTHVHLLRLSPLHKPTHTSRVHLPRPP